MRWSHLSTIFFFAFAILSAVSGHSNKDDASMSLFKRVTPPSSPRKSTTPPPGSPRKSTTSPPGSPRKSTTSPPGSPRKSTTSPPGSPRKSTTSPPGSPRKSTTSPPGSPRKSTTSPPGSPSSRSSPGSPKSHPGSSSGGPKTSSEPPAGYRKGTGNRVDSHGYFSGEPEFVKLEQKKPASPPPTRSNSPLRAKGKYYSPEREEIVIAGPHKGAPARTVIWKPERATLGGKLKSIGNRLGFK
ncbi:uncharacterized protein FA14DRAFT_182399 [Meira miltonrushii]|uniref:Uncharacterized protein n=1 Tax=Meira miltonrushii TaxID=1280837 RepID=A0A316V2B5_9BASI|nr:uncharacterized protein FA14DRAFT_182399 [Meira miltonrushii]PWN31602.1 hypothetical protein FA14DRAFT_182399 [Meira miltonrushii]